MKRLIKFAAIVVVALAAIGTAMYALGGRIYMDGGGGLHIGFPESPIAHEQTVEQHRKAQESANASTATPRRRLPQFPQLSPRVHRRPRRQEQRRTPATGRTFAVRLATVCIAALNCSRPGRSPD
jgi:hypothetical protein